MPMILEQKCKNCNGTGKVEPYTKWSSNDRLGYGTGHSTDVCPNCKNGLVPSEDGQTILNFVNKYTNTSHTHLENMRF